MYDMIRISKYMHNWTKIMVIWQKLNFKLKDVVRCYSGRDPESGLIRLSIESVP